MGPTDCTSYIIFDMCVRDQFGDGAVDMVYFSDTDEIFMYREGTRDRVELVMPLHRCAVPLNEGMQATTNRILLREDLSMSQELAIKKALLTNYMAAKPEIDVCNARFADKSDGSAEEEPIFMDDSSWDGE